MQPLNDRLILAPSESLMRGGIFIPDSYKDAATSCLVMAKGPRVTPFIKVGDTVMCQTGFGERKNATVGDTRQFWCREHNIYAAIKNKIIYPLGRTVLVKRDIGESVVNGIIVPENRRYQSLDGWIVRVGLSTKPFRVSGLRAGMKIRLTEWQPHMIGMTLEDGSYGLIVQETDLLFVYGDDNNDN